jgi:hypothetical protein
VPVSDFTKREPFVATEDDVKARWGSQAGLFRCAICGLRFKVGDMARWFYTNTDAKHKTIRGNPFICGDGRHGSDDDVTEELVAMADAVTRIKNQYWWFFRSNA